MIFESKSLWLAKDAEHVGEYQDAYCVDAERGIAAIADGVSSAIFSRRWAEILTARAVEDPPQVNDREAFAAWLVDPRQQWAASIDPSKLAWHQRSKLQAGAFSTLLAAKVAPAADSADSTYGLTAWAVGDCNLFHVRDGQMLCSFPIEESAQFGIDPLALGSMDVNRDHLIEFCHIQRECLTDDLLVLATDAIGSWALTEYEAGRTVDWNEFWNMTDDRWASRILDFRQKGEMRVDDATLLLLKITASD